MLASPLARCLAKPLASSLVAAPSGLDHATLGYLGVIRATGVTVTSTQQNAIDAFIVAEKDAGRWDSHVRIYLPIWGSAAANAICMKTCTSGTFVNSPTHGAGFVKGNGSTSYFDTGISPTTAGFSTTNGQMFCLIKTADTRTDARAYIGAGDSDGTGSGDCRIYQNGATSLAALLGRVPATPVAALTAARNGILVANRNAGEGLKIHRRATAGVTRSAAVTGTGAVASQNMVAMGTRYSTGPTSFSNAELGAYGLGTGLANDATVDAFTSNLKTLWETCTGLTLP